VRLRDVAENQVGYETDDGTAVVGRNGITCAAAVAAAAVADAAAAAAAVPPIWRHTCMTCERACCLHFSSGKFQSLPCLQAHACCD
jgi:hypothetical protein